VTDEEIIMLLNLEKGWKKGTGHHSGWWVREVEIDGLPPQTLIIAGKSDILNGWAAKFSLLGPLAAFKCQQGETMALAAARLIKHKIDGDRQVIPDEIGCDYCREDGKLSAEGVCPECNAEWN
jgi:hypothetical protein